MSETFCNAFANFPGQHRGGSCGVPLAGVAAKLLDERGQEVADDAPGVLWLRHPSLALGYKSAEMTARAFRDGWFCTGDLFTRDADGFWSHQGRADELYRIAGQWVKPAELEETVLADRRIREAACVVVPDADGLDRLALFVVGADDRAVEVALARLGELPRHARPKWVRAVTELPRTATGKVQRFRLREQLVAELRRRGLTGDSMTKGVIGRRVVALCFCLAVLAGCASEPGPSCGTVYTLGESEVAQAMARGQPVTKPGPLPAHAVPRGTPRAVLEPDGSYAGGRVFCSAAEARAAVPELAAQGVLPKGPAGGSTSSPRSGTRTCTRSAPANTASSARRG